MPICTSSESLRTTLSMRSRLTYVPLRLPASATENSPPSRVNTAWRRETVTSSRKISLSLWRPAVTSSWSSRNRLPALGPFCTTSIALPVGRASTAAASTGLRCRSEVSAFSGGVPMLIVAVASSAPGWSGLTAQQLGAAVASRSGRRRGSACHRRCRTASAHSSATRSAGSNPQERVEGDGFPEPTSRRADQRARSSGSRVRPRGSPGTPRSRAARPASWRR